MNPAPRPIISVRSTRTALLVAAACHAFLLSSSYSQSAANFEAEPLPPEVANPSHKSTENTKKPATPAAPVTDEPSRLAGLDTEAYTAARLAVLSIRTRPTDPFGLYQDASQKPAVVQRAPDQPVRRQIVEPPVPLSEIVQNIRITTIMPADRMFLVGTRQFAQNDVFPLIFRSRTLNIRVTNVSASKIGFLNIDTNEAATLEMALLPPGMVAGNGKMTPPGMVSATDDIPLSIDSSPILNAN